MFLFSLLRTIVNSGIFMARTSSIDKIARILVYPAMYVKITYIDIDRQVN